LLAREGFEHISAPDEINADVLVDWARRCRCRGRHEELGRATGTEVFAPRLPSDVNNLHDVVAIPQALAAFLALLAALAVTHALISTVRMRGHDLRSFERSASSDDSSRGPSPGRRRRSD
jgi:hypothetical protein